MPEKSFPVESRPFLPFVEGPKNKLRRRARGGGAKPRENPAQHGHNLLGQIEAFQRMVEDQEARRSPDRPPLPEEIQAIIETNNLPLDRVGGLGLTPLEERDGGLLVAVSTSRSLPVMAGKAQAYVSERTESDNPRYEGLIAPIEQVRPATRADRIGDRLAEWLAAGKLGPDELLWVDIELAGGKTPLGQQNRQQFYEYVHGLDAWLPAYAEHVVAATSHFIVEEEYSLHRVLLPIQAIEDLLDNSRASWILLIDLIPQIEDRTVAVPELVAGDLPELPALPAEAPRVVIVDSGIAADHPLFYDGNGRTIVGRQVNFLPEAAEPRHLTTDEVEHGHGTAVASIAAYGSLRDLVVGRPLETKPPFWIENAKVLLPASKLNPQAPADQPQFHPTQLPKTLMRQVVEVFHQELPRQCKIFNISAGSAPYHQGSISNWAEELDNLSAQNDVLFVVTAGNLQPDEIVSLCQEAGDYPGYLLDEQARLRNPGHSFSALTVGALADQPVAPAPFAKSDTSPAGFPAPFSRSGQPGSTLVKPDVVEVGGSLNLNSATGQPELQVELAVPVASSGSGNGSQGLLGFQAGTGLATARITHLAGRIQAQNPEASSNLIRALVVNSADWPAAFVQNLKAGPDEELSRESTQQLLRLCGYGLPRADKALTANNHCMVFVAEDEFTWVKEESTSSRRYPAKVSFYSVRLNPDDIFKLPPATPLRVSVTLAYNPPVRKTQRRNYQGLQLRWTLRRRDETSEEFQARWLAEIEADDNDEERENLTSQARPWPWQLKPALNPGGRVRRGTLIRDWFEVFAHELPPVLEMVVLATVAPWCKPPEPLRQQFALVVSIESRDPDLPFYDVVRIQAPGETDEE